MPISNKAMVPVADSVAVVEEAAAEVAVEVAEVVAASAEEAAAVVVAASEEVAAVLTVAVEADAEVVAAAADSVWAAVAVVAAVAVDDPPHINKVFLSFFDNLHTNKKLMESLYHTETHF